MNHLTLLDKLGGVTKVAGLLGIRKQSVSEWKTERPQPDVIPEIHLIKLAVIAEQRGITTRKRLFPKNYASIWPELA